MPLWQILDSKRFHQRNLHRYTYRGYPTSEMPFGLPISHAVQGWLYLMFSWARGGGNTIATLYFLRPLLRKQIQADPVGGAKRLSPKAPVLPDFISPNNRCRSATENRYVQVQLHNPGNSNVIRKLKWQNPWPLIHWESSRWLKCCKIWFWYLFTQYFF